MGHRSADVADAAWAAEAPEAAGALETAVAPQRRLPASLQQLLEEEPGALADDRQVLVRGVVLRCKVLGRGLAFCTLLTEEAGGAAGSESGGGVAGGAADGGEAAVGAASGAAGAYGSPARPATIGLCFKDGLVGALEAVGGADAGGGPEPPEALAPQLACGPWAAAGGSPCPGRRSDLPVGTRLEAFALRAPAYRTEELLVLRWRALLAAPGPRPPEGAPQGAPPPEAADAAGRAVGEGAPAVFCGDMATRHSARDAANRAARAALRAQGGRGPALCKHWAAGRAAGLRAGACDGGAPASPRGGGCCAADCGFRHSFADAAEERRALALEASRQRSLAAAAVERSAYDDVGDGGAHGADAKGSKALRAARFAAWLLATYGREALAGGRGVLDVAGGRGDLSWALSVGEGVPSTVVDPALRRGGQLRSWQRRALRRNGGACFDHVAAEFGECLFGHGSHGAAGGGEAEPPYAALLRGASLVVGLHPDEATEAIVDVALAGGRKFAVVPCCVFANKFPHRRMPAGGAVRTLNEFCAYLRAKDPRIQEALLDFEGRNKVLYLP